MSIRKLASETKISWVSIFNSLKHLKKDIKENFLKIGKILKIMILIIK